MIVSIGAVTGGVFLLVTAGVRINPRSVVILTGRVGAVNVCTGEEFLVSSVAVFAGAPIRLVAGINRIGRISRICGIDRIR